MGMHGTEEKTMNPHPWDRAPRIGITTAYKKDEQILEANYIRAVEAAGGMPLILPMLTSEEAMRSLVRDLDGLVMVGGPAITKGLVGELPDDLNRTDPLRTKCDELMLQAFLGLDRPFLGICYGMQMLNALSGGTIYADVQNQLAGALRHSHSRGAGAHQITINRQSRLYDILGFDRVEVNTMHMQAVDKVGQGLRITARAPDGVIEAIENSDGRCLGVQFHPERMLERMLPLFEHFIKSCRTA